MRQLSLLLLSLLLPLSLWGQSKSVHRMLQHLSSQDGVTIAFSMTSEEAPRGEESITGTYYAKGQKFYIETNILKAWYNSREFWIYSYANQEINLSQPTAEEITQVNPLINLSQQQRNFSFKVEREGTQRLIVATPRTPNSSETEWIKVHIDSNDRPTRLFLKERGNKALLKIEITKLKSHASLPTTLFEYTSSQAPGIPVIDLR